MNMSQLEAKFYSVLLSQKGDPINDALEILKKSKLCAKTLDDHALMEDLHGEASRLAYTYSDKKEFFDYALSAYNKAIEFNTARNEKIYWHMARLMRSAKRYPEAIQYINKVLEMRPKPKDPLPYLETAFQLAVDTKQWDDAKGLMEELSRRNKRFYADPDLLLSSVEALCHFNQIDDAKKIIQNVEVHVSLNEADMKILRRAKEVAGECESKR